MSEFLERSLKRTEEQIEQLEMAIPKIIAGAIQSYTFNSGQTQETVTRANLSAWESVLDSLYNRRATMRARLYGDGVITVRPGW